MNLDYIKNRTKVKPKDILNSLVAYQNAANKAAIVSITNNQGKIVFVNDRFCQASKYSRAELLGQDQIILKSGLHRPEFFAEIWKETSQGKVWHGEIQYKAKDGTLYWTECAISPILNERGNISQFLSIATLITERKKLEEEKQKVISDLSEKHNKLMQFNLIVSHNLRTPVGNIIGLAELLREDCKGSENHVKELIDYIDNSAVNVLETIQDLNQILLMDKLGDKVKEQVKIIDILHSVRKSLQQEIRNSGAIIEVMMRDCDSRCRTIKTYLHSIFFNLISNAIKYKKNGLVPLIRVVIGTCGSNYQIQIVDNGCGIDLQKVGSDFFKPYKRFSANGEGKGLGLYMTKTQVEALGGTIAVESKPGRGTTFIINLPIDE